jgi:transcriptional regulator with XRE-family HTH domain
LKSKGRRGTGWRATGRHNRRIAELRKLRGLTEPELAKKAGCSTEFISLVERGVNAPSMAGPERFAKALKVEVFDLFTFARQKRTWQNRCDSQR